MFERCRSTVRTLTTNRAAISSFVSPAATSSSTSSSRAAETTRRCRKGKRHGPSRGTHETRTRNSLPRRLVGKQDVIGGVEHDQARFRDQRRQQPPLLDRDHVIVPRMDDQRPRLHARGVGPHVHGAARPEQPNRLLGRGGRTQELVVPGHLLRRAAGMNSRLNRCRYARSSPAHPARIAAISASSCACCPRAAAPARSRRRAPGR